jgi:hypothetical protein
MLEGKEQDFEVSERKWGVHVNGGIIEKNGQLYLNVIEEAKVGTAVYETENGVEVKYADLPRLCLRIMVLSNKVLRLTSKIRTFKLENVVGMFIPSLQVRYNPNK